MADEKITLDSILEAPEGSNNEGASTPAAPAAPGSSPAKAAPAAPGMFGGAPKAAEGKPSTAGKNDAAASNGGPGKSGGFGKYEKKKEKDDTAVPDGGVGLETPTAILLIVVFGVFGFIFNYFYVYFRQASAIKIDPNYNRQIARVQSAEEAINGIVAINDNEVYKQTSFLGEDASTNLANIVGSNRLNYVHKRDLTAGAVNQVGDDIVLQRREIDNIRTDIAEFGFYPQEISDLLRSDKTKASIQESLLSLETIKFATAFKVFSLLDSYMTPLARQMRVTRSYADNQMRLFLERGEVDIANYLQSCRHNPFDLFKSQCNIVADFENYFTYLEPSDDFDIKFFKTAIELAEQKLEEEQFPSLSLVFDRFDPNSQKISFTAKVNTTKFDRAQIRESGVKSPHVFVIASLIDLLRQSKFVLGDSININKLIINRRMINIGGTQEEIYSSELRFSLPLQKSTQREIYDYKFKSEFEIDNVETVNSTGAAIQVTEVTN